MPDNAGNKEVTWSSADPDIVSVTQSGEIKALKAGSTRITATSKENSSIVDHCLVEVVIPHVESVNVTPKDKTLTKIGEKFTVSATVLPDNAGNKEVTWSSADPDIATVSTSGEVTAIKAGRTRIKATSKENLDISGYCDVEVVIPHVESVTVSPADKSLIIGQTLQLNATVLPDNAENKEVTWSSIDPDIATVSLDGLVTAKAEGSTKIVATSKENSDIKGNCYLEVTRLRVESIEIINNPTKTSYIVGDTIDTAGMKLKVNYNDGTSKNITTGWEISPTTATSAGTQTITVTYEGATTTFDVTVNNPSVPVTLESIDILTKPTKLTYTIGEPIEDSGMKLRAYYSDGSTNDISSGWDINPTKATSVGTQTITVTYGGETKTYTVTVNDVTVPVTLESIEIVTKPTKLTYTVGESISTSGMKLRLYFSDGSTTDVSTGWTINPTKATSAGTQRVIVTYDEKTTYYNVTVEEAIVPVTSVEITQYNTGINLSDGPYQFKARVLPTNATNSQIEWQSSNTSVATVDENGWVTPKKAGNTTITVSSKENPSIKAEKRVTILGEVTEIVLTTNNYPGKVGDKIDLNSFLADPSPLYNGGIEYFVSNSLVADFISSGAGEKRIELLRPGTTIVTYKYAPDNSIYAELTITVDPLVTESVGTVSYGAFNGSLYGNSSDGVNDNKYTFMYDDSPEHLDEVAFYKAEDSNYQYVDGVILGSQGFIRAGYNIINFSHLHMNSGKYNVNATYGAPVEIFNRSNNDISIRVLACSHSSSNTKYYYTDKQAEEIAGIYETRTVSYKIFNPSTSSYTSHNLTCGGGTYATITIPGRNSAWFFIDDTFNTSTTPNGILDGYLMIYSNSDNVTTLGSSKCPALVCSEYVFKSGSSGYLVDATPINNYYEKYDYIRRVGDISSEAINNRCCSSHTYEAYVNNRQTNGYLGSETVASYSNIYAANEAYQVGVSNYLPKISVNVSIDGDYVGFVNYSSTKSSNYATYGKYGLRTNVKTNTDNTGTSDIMPLNNCYYNNTGSPWLGALSTALTTGESNWSNWGVPTIVEYRITNNSSKKKDYIIYNENRYNSDLSNPVFGNITCTSGNDDGIGSATFIYRNNSGTWSYCNNYSGTRSHNGNSSDTPNNYKLSEKAATIAEIGSIEPGETKKIRYTSYLVNQCRCTMYQKMYVANYTSSSTNNALVELQS